jgi:hypothetical protein
VKYKVNLATSPSSVRVIRIKKYDVKIERTKLIMMELKNPIKMSKIGKMMSSPIPFGHWDYHRI